MKKKSWTILFFQIVLLSWLMMGCATVNKSSAEYVQERANLRWQALIKKDWNAAYQFELPAYRQAHDVSQYMAKFGKTLQWKSVKVDDAVINASSETADVALTLTFDVVMPGAGKIETHNEVRERWLKQDNEWWLAD